MKYQSTRGGVEPIDFQDAVMMGLAEDGGLVIPAFIPDVRDRLTRWSKLPYVDLAAEVIGLYATDIPPADLRSMIERAYGPFFPTEVAPVREVGEVHILELFHGPTLAFKDVALQLLGNLFEYILARRGGRLNILGATSGDTGSAAIAGVRGREGIDIFVMHPEGRTSPIQQRQMTTVLDENVHNIAVRGSFDDCQRIMKTLSGDLEFKRRYALGAVNSVNWARVLAQIVYYFHGVFRVQEDTGQSTVDLCVPTGNFGDILAGWYARQMGLPIGRLICATNQNDILARFFNTGEYSLGEVHRSHSPSMDIQVASNFERYLYYLLGEDGEALKARMAEFARTGALHVEAGDEGVDPTFTAGRASEQQTLDAIRRTWDRYHYLLDPHTAVGVHVAGDRIRAQTPMLCLATAHPAKFPAAIAVATGREDIATHPTIEKLAELPTRCVTLDDDVQAVRAFIEQTVDPVD
ncbi:MAG: threonine synthase [Phycisphaerae bacterium]